MLFVVRQNRERRFDSSFLFDATAIPYCKRLCLLSFVVIEFSLVNSFRVSLCCSSCIQKFLGGAVMMETNQRERAAPSRIGECYNSSTNDDDDDCFLIGKTSAIEFFMLFTRRLAIGWLNEKSIQLEWDFGGLQKATEQINISLWKECRFTRWMNGQCEYDEIYSRTIFVEFQ